MAGDGFKVVMVEGLGLVTKDSNVGDTGQVSGELMMTLEIQGEYEFNSMAGG